jgi:hypothetical protein
MERLRGKYVAKRFTDTDKWKKRWFRELGGKLRDVRQFILDDCDLAGVWDIDLDRVAYHTCAEWVTLEEVKKAFNQELILLGDGFPFCSCILGISIWNSS